MTRRRGQNPQKATTVAPELKAAWTDLYADIYRDFMDGLLKADTVEAEYAKLQAHVRKTTAAEIDRIARCAGERFVELANPSPVDASKNDLDRWKREAIEYALKSKS